MVCRSLSAIWLSSIQLRLFYPVMWKTLNRVGISQEACGTACAAVVIRVALPDKTIKISSVANQKASPLNMIHFYKQMQVILVSSLGLRLSLVPSFPHPCNNDGSPII